MGQFAAWEGITERLCAEQEVARLRSENQAPFKEHPCYALCKRLMRHREELFQFVRVEGLSADNNHAEHSLRPLVVVRKISGGSRSPRGSRTAWRSPASSVPGTPAA